MAAERHGQVDWPGAISVESCTFTLSHGISPSTAVLRIHPQDGPPQLQGGLQLLPRLVEVAEGAVDVADGLLQRRPHLGFAAQAGVDAGGATLHLEVRGERTRMTLHLPAAGPAW